MNIRRPFALQIALALYAADGNPIPFHHGPRKCEYMEMRARFAPTPDPRYLAHRKRTTRNQFLRQRRVAK